MPGVPARVRSLAAAVLVTSAAGFAPVALAAPASAAACSTSTGVTVIADFNQLGGVSTVCVGDGAGKSAAVLFDEAGLKLRYAARQPGFVCRVLEKPASDPCVNTSPENAYWGLWWSDGDAGSGWTYSTLGVGPLKIPAGGVLAFSWDQVDGDERPSAPSSRPAPAPAPTPAPTPAPSPPTSGSGSGSGSGQGGKGGSGSSDGPSGSPDSAAPAPSDGAPDSEAPAPGSPTDPAATGSGKKAGTKPGKGNGKGSGTASGKASDKKAGKGGGKEDRGVRDPPTGPDTEGDSVTSDDPALVPNPQDAAADADGGLPVWTAPALIVLLFGGAGVAWWVRRRGAAGS